MPRRVIRDDQRQRIYDWEKLYIDPSDEDVLTQAEIIALCHDMASAYTMHTPTVLLVEDTKTRRSANFDVGYGPGGRVKFPPWARTRPSICHEMAHCIEYQFDGQSAAHGSKFLAIFMNLLNLYCNIPMSELERTATIHKLDWKPETQPVMQLNYKHKRGLSTQRDKDFKLPEFVRNHHKLFRKLKRGKI